ncbi:type IV secretion system protein TraC (plasmid) [Ahniella affigens]|uniref:Type IV secretion system protein TraC n=1 Tax=Ahniella affigens TaxID=2021234 RepID=A0A2P1PZW0_9GAMM|nr:TraC family protein [Ahniella affigens]AVQ00382.1 type IV secretion system protein TraC [Ahniella affigens]
MTGTASRAAEAEIRGAFFSARAFDPDSGVFLLTDGTGFGFALTPVAGAGDLLRDKLLVALNLPFPPGSVVSISRFASPDIQPYLLAYQSLRRAERDPILASAARRRVDFLRAGANPTGKLPSARTSQVMVTVKLPMDSRSIEEQVHAASDISRSVEQALRSAQIHPSALNPETYIRFMNVLLNHGPNASWRGELHGEYDPEREISDQFLDSDTHIDLSSPFEIRLGAGAVAVLLHPKRIPDELPFGAALRYLCDTQTGVRGIREPCLITANLVYEDHDARSASLRADELYATNQADKSVSKYFPENRERLQSIRIMNESLKQGDRIVKTSIGMAVFGADSQTARAAATNAQTYWRELGMQLMLDAFALGPLFQNLLPFCADPKAQGFLKRFRTMTTRHALAFAPLLGSWRGTGTPTLSLVARDGEAMAVCPFDSQSGKNFYIAAKTGAGKSFFANELVVNLRMQGGRVYIIDAGKSYQNLAETLGGAFVDFDASKPIGLNPFPLIRDWNDEEDMIVTIFEAMATSKSPLSDFQRASLREHLSRMYEEFGSDSSVDRLIAVLAASTDQRMSDLATQLRPFGSSGAYGAYFNGPNTLDLSNPLSVYEVQALEHREALQRVVLLQLMYQINSEIYHGDVGVRKMLLIDEAWAMIAKPEMATFIFSFYRRIRKHGGSVGIITQSVADLYETSAGSQMTGGRVIAENSASVYLLAQKPESITAAVQSGRMPFNEWQVQQLRSVHTEPGVYSEIFCATERGSGIGRLIVSPADVLMYSTDPRDRAAIQVERAKGLSLSEAIAAVLTKRQVKP